MTIIAWTYRSGIAAGLALTLLLAGPQRAPANSDLRPELARAARVVARALQAQGEKSIAVGQFTGPANVAPGAGPGIALVLAEELRKVGLEIKARARLGVKGQYLLTEVPAEEADDRRLGVKFLAVKVQGTVEDVFGKEVVRFGTTVRDPVALVRLLGLPVHLPASETVRQRDRLIRTFLEQPTTAIAGGLVSAARESPYAVEILVNDQPVPAHSDAGLAFVGLDPAAAFAVRLINNSDHEAAVRLSVDGVDLFAFSKERHARGPSRGEPLYSVVLVPAHKSVVVKGWHRTNKVAELFRPARYPGDAPVALKARGGVGAVTASFAAAWAETDVPPKDEAPVPRGQRPATGYGPGVEANFQMVKRRIGVLRDSVSIRYKK